MAEPDADGVVQWMLDQLEHKAYLYQHEVVHELQTEFGGSHLYTNANGNPAIARQVLARFRALTADTAIWSKSERRWRKRKAEDPPGRLEP